MKSLENLLVLAHKQKSNWRGKSELLTFNFVFTEHLFNQAGGNPRHAGALVVLQDPRGKRHTEATSGAAELELCFQEEDLTQWF